MHAAGIRAEVLDAMVEVLSDARECDRGHDEFGIFVYERSRGSRVGSSTPPLGL
jgi:hypothetical protein